MRETILAALKTKFEGVNDAILGKTADNLARNVTTQEEATAAVDGYSWAQLVESEADRRATEAGRTAVANYKKKETETARLSAQPVQGTATDTTPKADNRQTADGNNVPEWAKAIMDANKQLQESLNRMTAERTTELRRAKFNEVIGSLPPSIQKAYRHTPLTGSDDDFEAMLAEIRKDTAAMTDDIRHRGAVFGRPTMGANGKKDELSKEQMDRLRPKGATANPDGQPF